MVRFRSCLAKNVVQSDEYIHEEINAIMPLSRASMVDWGEDRIPTLCHKTGGMQYHAGVDGLMAAYIFLPSTLPVSGLGKTGAMVRGKDVVGVRAGCIRNLCTKGFAGVRAQFFQFKVRRSPLR